MLDVNNSNDIDFIEFSLLFWQILDKNKDKPEEPVNRSDTLKNKINSLFDPNRYHVKGLS